MMSPKSIAPRLIKLPEMPKRVIPVMAKRNASGIAVATISAARQLPRRTHNNPPPPPDKHRPLEKICGDGVDRPMNQILSVVLRLNNYAGRQQLFNLFHLVCNTLCDCVAVLAREHQGNTKHGFLTAAGCSASTKRVADLNFGQVLDAHRHHAGRKLYRKLSDLLR